MRLKFIIPVLALIAGGTYAAARTLTPEEALLRLNRGNAPRRAMAWDAASHELVKAVDAADGLPALYAFEDARGGYMIVSADDCAEPLLGYSPGGSLTTDSLPASLQWWLDEYSRQIQYAREKGIAAQSVSFPVAKAGRRAVEPLIKSSWDQGEPYNIQCPAYDGERTWTGCVATSMAQVMNYFKYPAKGQGSISYDAASISKRLSLNFSLKKFDWDNMLDRYDKGAYTDEQSAAVAYLMKACGYSVKMDYGLDASGALAMNIRKALIKYFNYDENIRHELRQLYTATEWGDIIYNSVAEGCPVLYGGGSMIGGGHSFICDGYDGDGYFHFNWGWTGMSDGYFLLDALNPYALGAGGGAGGGYNFTQDAVVGVQPPTGKPAVESPLTLVQTGSLAMYERNDSICFDLFAENGPMWVNYNPETLKFTLGAIVERTDDPTVAPVSFAIAPAQISLGAGYGTGPVYFTPGIEKKNFNVADGTYKVTIAICHDGTSEYIPVKCNRGYSNYATVKKQGNNLTIVNEDVYRLEVKEAKLLQDLYYGMATKLGITVANDSEIEMTRGFAPVLISDNSVVMLGESIYLTVKPGETVYREWVTPLYQLQQYFTVESDMKVTLTLFDESTYNMWIEDVHPTVTLHPSPGRPDITTVRAPKIANSKLLGSALDLDRISSVQDPSNMEISATLRLDGGLFGYELLAFIVNDDMSIEKSAGEVMFINTPQTFTFNTTIDFSNAEREKVYNLMIGYNMGGQAQAIGPDLTRFVVPDTAGIENVTGDGGVSFDGATVTAPGCTIAVYNLGGVQLLTARDEADLSSLAPGIYIVKAGDKTIKIAL